LYALSPESLFVPAAGGDYDGWVINNSTDNNCMGPASSGCPWIAESSASWVTVLSSMPRSGDNPFSFRVAVNGTGAVRSARITVRDKTLLITQAGS
jgi:hypothetical protein